MIKLGNDRQLAYAVLRITLGINILFHGLVRFGDHYGPFVNDTVHSFEAAPIPSFLVRIIAALIPIAEFAIGALLAIGFKTREAALVGAALMVSLIAGMTLLEEWDIVGAQMLYVLFYAGVLAFREYNYYSIDQKFWRA